METGEKDDRFVVVGWPECQHFMDDRSRIHLADGLEAYMDFGDSAYFVAVGYYEEVTGRPLPEGEAVYLAVSYPRSRGFADSPYAYPVKGNAGLERYGPWAFFIEEGHYCMAGLFNGLQEVNSRVRNGTANLMDIFLHEAVVDSHDTAGTTACLKDYFEGAGQMQRAAINETFVFLCGHSYEDLTEMEDDAGKENEGGNHPAP